MTDIKAQIKEFRIGDKVRFQRQQRRLTLQDLSDLTGLSKPLLSQIENEQVVPPLATLLRIARGLKVTIHYFFEEEDNSQKLMITHSDAIPPGLQRVSSGDQRPYTYHSLAQGLRHKHMEPFLIEIDNTTWHDSLLFSHEGEEEFLYVLDGEVELHYGDERYSLKQGDSAYYDSGIHHGLVATGLSQARVVAVLYST